MQTTAQLNGQFTRGQQNYPLTIIIMAPPENNLNSVTSIEYKVQQVNCQNDQMSVAIELQMQWQTKKNKIKKKTIQISIVSNLTYHTKMVKTQHRLQKQFKGCSIDPLQKLLKTFNNNTGTSL